MSKKLRFWVWIFSISVISFFINVISVFAQETLTITTYYPSPYGSYRELTSYRMKIGTNYSGSSTTVADNDLIVEGKVGIGTINPETALDVGGYITTRANRTYIRGFDGAGIHWFNKGTNEPDDCVLGIDTNGFVYIKGVRTYIWDFDGAGIHWFNIGRTPEPQVNALGIDNNANVHINSIKELKLSKMRADTEDGIRIYDNNTDKWSQISQAGATYFRNDPSTEAGFFFMDNNSNGAFVISNYGNTGLTSYSSVGAVTTKSNIDINSYVNFNAGHNDLAEYIPNSHKLEAGDVVVIDPDIPEHVKRSFREYDTLVAGIVSEKPEISITGGNKKGKMPVALVGRIKCKVTTLNGRIKIGDLLVTSSKAGYAMKAIEPKIGTVLGKALEPLNKGEGKIMVLVTLH